MTGRPVCQSCGAEVVWRVTVDGRRVPLDPGADPMGVVRRVGDRVRFLSKKDAEAARAAGEQLLMPHHATCASVERHRVPRAQESLF